MVEVSGQTECSSVTSFQCRSSAICFSGVNQSPASESPTSATVSTGSLVSPYTHSLGAAELSAPRQPSCQYSGRLTRVGGGMIGSVLIVVVALARAPAPG